MAGPVSSLLIDAAFDAEDGRFVELLRERESGLAAITERWKRDPRPWARGQKLAYLDLPMDRRGHEVVVKRLFKDAEQRGDHEVVAACLVAFDRLVRRRVTQRWNWDSATRQASSEEVLSLARDRLPPVAAPPTKHRDPQHGTMIDVPRRVPKDGRLFGHRTRTYLRRRAWRHFRRMGRNEPSAYVARVAAALRLYRDDDVAPGARLLECSGLLHACFGRHDALEFLARQVKLRPGRGLSELRAAPRFPELWKAPAAAATLLGLVATARSRLVRAWAMEMIRNDHRDTAAASAQAELIALLRHDDEEVQHFGAELFAASAGLERLPVDVWLGLLTTRGAAARDAILVLFSKHVTPTRLSPAQLVDLACRMPATVSRLGLRWLEPRVAESSQELDLFADLADAQCEATGAEAGALGLLTVGDDADYDTTRVQRFFDSRNASVRAAAWAWLPGSKKAADDATLWARLCETPYDDARARLVAALDRRASDSAPATDALATVWCSVLLSVHRGSRSRTRATRQLAEAMEHDAAQASRLLPVLVAAVRSVRGPDRRAGLAAAVRLVERRPELASRIEAALPELRVSAAGASS